MKKHIKPGISLIEIILVISITTILLVTAFVIYEQVRDRQLLNQEVNGAITMSSEVRSLNPEGGSYYGVDNYFLNNLKIFPSGFKVNPAKFNTLNGAFSVLGAVFTLSYNNVYTSEDTNNHTSGDLSAFSFNYSGMPQKYCLSFVNSLQSYAARIAIDGETLKDSIPEQAGNAAGTSSSNSVKYSFKNAEKLCAVKYSYGHVINLTFF